MPPVRQRPRPSKPDPHLSLAAQRGSRTTAQLIEDNRGPGLAVTALRTVAGFAIAAVLLLAIFLAASAIEGDDPPAQAPWAAKSAPAVAPPPLDVQ